MKTKFTLSVILCCFIFEVFACPIPTEYTISSVSNGTDCDYSITAVYNSSSNNTSLRFNVESGGVVYLDEAASGICHGSLPNGGGSFQLMTFSAPCGITAFAVTYTAFNNPGCSGSSSGCGSGSVPLPIELVTFLVAEDNNGNLLKWETSLELNADRFEIERSIDGFEFNKVGTVLTSGNYNGHSYEYSDLFTMSKVYYRLKMVDKDESFTYSDVKYLKRLKAPELGVRLLNSGNNLIELECYSQNNGDFTYFLFDLTGRLLLSGKHEAELGHSIIKIPTDQFSAQFGVLKVSSLFEARTFKVLLN